MKVQKLRQKWQDHLRKSISMDSIEEWLTEVQRQYLECQQAKVPEVKHEESVLFDLLRALQGVALNFCDIWYHEIFEKTPPTKITPPEFIRTFLSQFHSGFRPSAKVLRRRFPAALGLRFFRSVVSFSLLLPVLSWIASTQSFSLSGPPA